MRRLYILTRYIFIFTFFSSCSVRCSVGDNPQEPAGSSKLVSGARVYNDIQLDMSPGVKVEKAYLVFENGDPVPADNVIEFNQPVLLKLFVEDGWKEVNGKVNLGVEEIITSPEGNVILHEKDLFSKYPDGTSPKDARYLSIMAKIILKQKVPPLSTFGVAVRVWDKNSNNYIESNYKLFSK